MRTCLPQDLGRIRIYKGSSRFSRYYMAKVYDVPADELIAKLAEQLKNDKKVVPPAWSAFVKTGSHAARIPQHKDWWYARCASLLRKIYLHGPLGVGDLKGAYGGREKVGYKLARPKEAGGATNRKAFQQPALAGCIVK